MHTGTSKVLSTLTFISLRYYLHYFVAQNFFKDKNTTIVSNAEAN